MNRSTSGALAWMSIAHYFVVEEVVRRGFELPYSRSANVISDLGALACGTYHDRPICSPGHLLINLSFVLVGVAVVFGAVSLRTALPDLITRPAIALYAAAGVGTAMVGAFPVDSIAAVHGLGAGLFLVGANAGHVLLGRRLRSRRDRTYGLALAAVGVVGLVATALLACRVDLGLGIGAIERVIVYGADLGFIATGLSVLAPALRARRHK